MRQQIELDLEKAIKVPGNEGEVIKGYEVIVEGKKVTISSPIAECHVTSEDVDMFEGTIGIIKSRYIGYPEDVVFTNFGEAIEALKQGKRVQREGWNDEGLYVVKQVDSDISSEIVPKMQSLPQAAKDALYPNGISYRNQMIIINQEGVANSWVASSSDTFAEDWVILD